MVEGEFDGGPAEVDAACGGVDPGVVVYGDICCWNTELRNNTDKLASSVGKEEGGRSWGWLVGQTSFEPRPKPDITVPPMRSGKGFSGPSSGPIIFARGPSGLFILTMLCACCVV